MSLLPPTERQARIMWMALTGMSVAALVVLIVALVWGAGQVLRMLAPVLTPLAVAGILACLLDPLVDLFEKRGLTRPKAILCVFGLAVLLMGGVLASIVPQVVAETQDLVKRIPAYSTRLQAKAGNWLAHPPQFLLHFMQASPGSAAPVSTPASTNAPVQIPGSTNLQTQLPDAALNVPPIGTSPIDPETLQNAAAWLARSLPEAGSWLFGRVASWFGLVAGLALVPVYAFYFLLEKRGITTQWARYLPVKDSTFKEELVFIIGSINNYLVAFFRGQVLVAVCDGILYGVGFLLVGLPYAVLIGLGAMVLTMIPFLGAIVTCSAALIIAIAQFGDWKHPLLVLAVFGTVQALEGLFISPRIMGDRVGLHPVTIIISVMVGTTLFGGLLGGILAIPLTAALRVLMFRYIWKGAEGGTRKSAH